jgi:hypothetical protein
LPKLSRPAPGAHSRFVQIWHRQTKPAAGPRRASHITKDLTTRPLPKLSARLGIIVYGVHGVRCGPALPHGSSSGAGFGFWHLSAREDRRLLGRFRYRRWFIGIKSTRRTILVRAIHPLASPAIGQICSVLCMQVDEQSEQKTHAGEDRAAESDKYMPEGACPASNSCCMGRGARARHRLLQRWPSRTHRIR